jgi:hypothetical protein
MSDTQAHLAEILKNADPPQTLPAPSAPYEVAALFLGQKHVTANGERTLYSWQDTWMVWRGTHWRELTKTALRAQLYHFTAQATYQNAKGDYCKWSPTEKKISDLAGALASLCELPDTIDAPCWLDGRESGTVIAAANGLLDITSGQLHPHTPLFFNSCAVPFAYDPAAPEPKQWLAFIDAIWPSADGTTTHPAQDLLQEWFGYVLSGRTDLQKMLLMQGPTRGGRGTISRILTALLGRENVAGLKLDDLGENFGMAHLINKPLAIAGDERFSGNKMSRVGAVNDHGRGYDRSEPQALRPLERQAADADNVVPQRAAEAERRFGDDCRALPGAAHDQELAGAGGHRVARPVARGIAGNPQLGARRAAVADEKRQVHHRPRGGGPRRADEGAGVAYAHLR